MTQEAPTRLKVALITLVPLALSCAYASPIQPVATSKSPFWFLGWGEPVQVVSEIPEGEQFRVSHRASTGYTPVSAVRRSAEARAREFCERKNLQMAAVTEQVSSSPHILGNFPRAEIVFVCTEMPRENPGRAGVVGINQDARCARWSDRDPASSGSS